MKCWEYKIVYGSDGSQENVETIEDMLNHLGVNGWELVSAIGPRYKLPTLREDDPREHEYMFVLKRPRNTGASREPIPDPDAS